MGTRGEFQPQSDTQLPEGREETLYPELLSLPSLAYSRCSLKACGGFLESETAQGSRPLAHCPYLPMAQKMRGKAGDPEQATGADLGNA